MARAVSYGHLKESPARRLRLFNPDNRVENYSDPEQLDTLMATLRSPSESSGLSHRHVYGRHRGKEG